MKLYLRDIPVLGISENGNCKILDFDRLPFALRKEDVTYPEFVEWASNRTLSIGRSFAKEILNSLRLSQTNRYAVCKACRGLSLEDAYWIRQDGDEKTWKEVSLFENPLDMAFDYKAIFRRYLTGVESAWLSSQQVHSLNASLSYAIGNVSLYGSLSFDQTRQSIGESVLHDHHFLPVASLTYTNSELLDIRLNYARKITRPGVDDLNPAYTQIDPLTIQCGNTDLEAGLNNSLSLRLSRNVSNSTLSLTGFHNQNKQVIGLVMIPQGERLIYTYDNIGKIRSSGLRMGWYCSLPAGVYLNASVGPTHRDFRFSDPRSVVQENGGWAFSTFVNLPQPDARQPRVPAYRHDPQPPDGGSRGQRQLKEWQMDCWP